MTAQNNIAVPARSLVLSTQYQSRKTPISNEELNRLADSIAAIGLLQNLLVIKSKKKNIYEVVGGGNRLAAINLLIETGRWDKDQPIPVFVNTEDIALEVSITENMHRHGLHPADEFEAFAKLVKQNKSVEDIAAKFGVSPKIVKQRLRLASVAPELIDAYRADEMGLDLLMAFTVSNDKQRQRDVWAGMSGWEKNNPHIVRNRLTKEKLTAGSNLVRFVTLEAYEAAGGLTTHDLFVDENSHSIYINDVALVEQLAMQKLVETAEQLCNAGWRWAESRLVYDQDEFESYGQVNPTERSLTKAEAKKMAELESELNSVMEKIDAIEDLDDAENCNVYDRLSDKQKEIEHKLEEIKLSTRVWPSEMMSVAGCIVTVDGNGDLQIDYGLIKPEDREEVKEVPASVGSDSDVRMPSLPSPITRPTHSERLVKQLSAHKVGIVQASLANQHKIALAVLVAQLAEFEFVGGYRDGFGLGISRNCEHLIDAAPDWHGSKAHEELQSIRLHWLDQLPKNADGKVENLLAWAVDQDQDTLVELLAFLVAGSVQGIQHTESIHVTKLDDLATITGVTMTDWWKPTADSYFAHVSKDRIIDVVASVSAEAAVPIVKMKKAEAAQAAEVAIAGKNWLPEILHVKTENN